MTQQWEQPRPGSHVNTDWKQEAGQRKMEADAQRQISHEREGQAQLTLFAQ